MSAWNRFPVDYSYSSPCNTHFSLVDHFLLSKFLGEHVLHAGVIHRGDNVSGHAPIYLDIESSQLPRKIEPEIQKIPKQNWKAATEEDKMNYKNRLGDRLSLIDIPQDCLACEDLKCMNINHCESLDEYIIALIMEQS